MLAPKQLTITYYTLEIYQPKEEHKNNTHGGQEPNPRSKKPNGIYNLASLLCQSLVEWYFKLPKFRIRYINIETSRVLGIMGKLAYNFTL